MKGATTGPQSPAWLHEAPHAGVIESVHDPRARRVADVLRARGGARRTFLIDDEENIEQAARAGVRLDSLYLTTGAVSADSAVRAACAQGVPTYLLREPVAKELFGVERRSRVFAVAHGARPASLDDLSQREGDIVVLDGVRLMGNIGAITRTACALGAAGVVLLESGLTSTVDRRLVRASRGTVFALPVVLASRPELCDYLDSRRITLVGLAAGASAPVSQIDTVRGRVAILMGSERAGASPQMNARTRQRYAIPLSPDVESLNVSVATAIALYERHRGQASGYTSQDT